MADSDVEQASGTPQIVAACQQTRFNILDDKISSEVSIEQLTLSIHPHRPVARSAKAAGKSKVGRAMTHDILVDAGLKLKAGVHYGSGKSSESVPARRALLS
ncbi:hypothetical protein QQX98_009260 [Neonectria punicea]|uniref:Uncharacterized protein n=1 Tax=Neonectria punicea TaxID=979145 RepID=A0ABR1GSS8_9HYPO